MQEVEIRQWPCPGVFHTWDSSILLLLACLGPGARGPTRCPTGLLKTAGLRPNDYPEPLPFRAPARRNTKGRRKGRRARPAGPSRRVGSPGGGQGEGGPMSGRPGSSETQGKVNDTQARGLYDAGPGAMIHRAGALSQDLLVRRGSLPAACGLGPGPAPGPQPGPGPRLPVSSPGAAAQGGVAWPPGERPVTSTKRQEARTRAQGHRSASETK